LKACFEALPFVIEREANPVVGMVNRPSKGANEVVECGAEAADSVAAGQCDIKGHRNICLQLMSSIRRIGFDPYAVTIRFDESFPQGANLVNVEECSPRLKAGFVEDGPFDKRGLAGRPD
jgi:hypothetical protein